MKSVLLRLYQLLPAVMDVSLGGLVNLAKIFCHATFLYDLETVEIWLSNRRKRGKSISPLFLKNIRQYTCVLPHRKSSQV